MIPKILHCIWVWTLPPPTKWLKSWEDKHPERTYKLWGNKELKETNWENQKVIDYYAQRKEWNGVADCMRYEILFNEWWVLVWADWFCLNNIDDIFTDYDAYQIDTSHYWDNETHPNNIWCAMPLFACKPWFDWAKRLIELVSEITKFWKPQKTTWNRLMQKFNKENKEYNLKTLPLHPFMPEHFNGWKYEWTDKIYSKHFWGTTNSTYEQGL